MTRAGALLGVALLGLPASSRAGERVDYTRDVKPILARRCYACHGALKHKAGLRLDTGASIRRGGDSGPAAVAGASDESLLIDAVTGDDTWRMPPEGEPLSPGEATTLKAWIDQGADSPDGEAPQADPRRHWAFVPPTRPPLPKVTDNGWARNPIDAFVAAEHMRRGLRPAPEADRSTLVRRIYLDLIGLVPTPDERRAFLDDPAPDAYERLVDRLLDDARFGQRWARHWMDVWRYSDWDGYAAEVRESQPHIWRWRDWIVASLNADRGYDAMLVAMLAADEASPGNERDLPATGFLVRNWYKFNRNVWLDATVEHTAKAFLGITLNCARCHDHKYDPIAQADYYRFRAFFEPHDVRTDRLPGQPDTSKAGLVRVFDAKLDTPTFVFERGDDKHPVKDRPLAPGVPAMLAGPGIAVQPVTLPKTESYPGLKAFVRDETLARARANADAAAAALAKARERPDDPALRAAEKAAEAARAQLATVEAKLAADVAKYADTPRPEAEALAKLAAQAQRRWALLEAEARVLRSELALTEAKQKKKDVPKAEKALDEARKAERAARDAASKAATTYSPLTPVYPATSTGRRLALARWLTRRDNPLTARVAVNHVWARHFGAPLVPTTADFGLNGRPPTHPALLDWLAVEFVEQGWSLKALHRLIVTSRAYRMSATGDDANRAIDAANLYLWRMNPRRMEAELVRDNVLHVADNLDPALGGPDLDPATGLTSPRRSLYFRHAKEKRVVFLRLFDSANVGSCYRRTESVMPQQALALANSPLALDQSRKLAGRLPGDDNEFTAAAFERVLGREPTAEEASACTQYLAEQAARLADRTRLSAFTAGAAATVKPSSDPRQRARENLVHVLMNHNDFLTIR